MHFRSDIEGLRGAAVLMVVLAHAGVPGVAGGFVGVDVFFVISGFLITAGLADELRDRGAIRLVQFYARRVRRLVPALVCMLLLSSLMALLSLPIDGWFLQARSAYWAALWASNVYFSTASFGYFDAEAGSSLFLHTWSLGVEEQFYLAWPALLWCAWRWRGRRGLMAGAWVVVVLGFAAMVIATPLVPMHAYYQLPFRLWQLAFGAAVQLSLGSWRLASVPASLARWTGTLLLLSAAMLFDPARIAYPGAWSLVPTLGAAMLLLRGSDDGAWWLVWSPLRLLGRVSYSWYLWHWPLRVLAFACFGVSLLVGVAAAVVSLGVAWLSWCYIERPAQFRPVADGKAWLAAGLLATAMLALGADGWADRAAVLRHDASVSPLMRTLVAPSLYDRPDCDEWFHADRVVPCELVAQTGTRPRVLLVGDSVAAHWSPAFQLLAKKHRWELSVLTKSACLMVDQTFIYPILKRRYVECERWRDGVAAYLHAHPVDLLVLGSSATYAFTPGEWEQGTARWLARLRGGASHTLVMAPTPVLPFDGPQCVLALAEGRASVVAQGSACTAPLAEIRPAAVTEQLQRGASKEPGVWVLDPGEMVCPDGVCRAELDGMLLYRDAQHLNGAYAERLAPDLERALERGGSIR